MQLVLFLIIFPLVLALALLCTRNATVRKYLVVAGGICLSAASILLLVTNFGRQIAYFKVESVVADKGVFFLDLAMGVYILVQAWRMKRPLAAMLIVVQLIISAVFEVTCGHRMHPENNLFVDKLSIIMTMVIGIIGSLICVYAIGYMRDFHEKYHRALKDNRQVFGFLLFVFLSAMFGIVFSNNLLWFYFFWEVTTLCSFKLIGYKKTEESLRNAAVALEYNLLGGLFLLVGIVYFFHKTGYIELSKLMTMGKSVVLLPVVLISCAGLVKSAQLPFSDWLLGAMVAPTPVSALLHSSTMVKAGVYIVLRFASVLQGTTPGFMLALIGGLTFLITSCIAISQSDAKKVLAYSTIGNLGLIVMCAGVGTYEAVWAGALLIIFHAVAKCLLFLCVGVIEHKVHSRNIEDMSGLIITMPKLSIMMQVGMAGMFLAPFGMLISKWAVLKALVDFNPFLAIFVVFGSSAALMFWVKWMGTLISVVDQKDNLEETVNRSEWVALGALAGLTIGVCGLFPVVSSVLIEPYVIEIFGRTFAMSHGNIVIMLIMLAMVMLFPLSFFNYGKKVKVVDAYLGGANIDTHVMFRNSLDVPTNMQMKNYYMTKYFGEARWRKYGMLACAILVALLLLTARS